MGWLTLMLNEAIIVFNMLLVLDFARLGVDLSCFANVMRVIMFFLMTDWRPVQTLTDSETCLCHVQKRNSN